MIRNRILLIAIALLFLIGLGLLIIFEREPTYICNSRSQYIPNIGTNISPIQAISLASPYLDKSFKLRIADRPSHLKNLSDPPIDHVVKSGKWFLITRDNCPGTLVYFYVKHAVKVNSRTGEVIPPK